MRIGIISWLTDISPLRLRGEVFQGPQISVNYSHVHKSGMVILPVIDSKAIRRYVNGAALESTILAEAKLMFGLNQGISDDYIGVHKIGDTPTVWRPMEERIVKWAIEHDFDVVLWNATPMCDFDGTPNQFTRQRLERFIKGMPLPALIATSSLIREHSMVLTSRSADILKYILARLKKSDTNSG